MSDLEPSDHVVETIAEQLNEPEKGLLEQVVRLLGLERSLILLQKTLEIEAGGGMMVRDGTRRRTPGGVFFYLVRAHVPEEVSATLFPTRTPLYRRQRAQPAFLWETRGGRLDELAGAPEGMIQAMEVRLVGRPERVEEKEEGTWLWMSYEIDPDHLPNRLPPPPSGPMLCLVYLPRDAEGHGLWQQGAQGTEQELALKGTLLLEPEQGCLLLIAKRASVRMRRESQRRTQLVATLLAKPGQLRGHDDCMIGVLRSTPEPTAPASFQEQATRWIAYLLRGQWRRATRGQAAQTIYHLSGIPVADAEAGGIALLTQEVRLPPPPDTTPRAPRPEGSSTAPLDPEVHQALIEQLLSFKNEIGRAQDMKMTLMGRPGKVIVQGDFVVTTMKGNGRVPSLPKGLPAPPENKLLYLVYVARKQWSKVEEALQDPEDILIIEGYPTYDTDLKKMSVYATQITTRALQRAKRQPR